MAGHRISIFGLGYMGAVSCGCLAKQGHKVVGVDISKKKIDLINTGKSPIMEEEIENLIQEVVSDGRLKAIQSTNEAIQNTEITFVCVGTPSRSNGNIDLSQIETVCKKIGKALKNKNNYHIIVIRSTILPGTTKGVVAPILSFYSGKRVGVDFGVCFNPDFTREGTAVYDFFNPPKTVIGALDNKSAQILTDIYKVLPAEIITTSMEIAEIIKYVDNCFHAVKVTFGNEIGLICKQFGIDSHQVMDIFCKDTKLNISTNYFTPRFAFGGSCLPKDVRALTYAAKNMHISIPLLDSLMKSNHNQIQNAIDLILDTEKKDIGILGFSFKAGTDDLRESPIITVIESLISKGCRVKLFDNHVNIANLIGANKRFINERIPHITELMCEDLEEVLIHSEVIVIGNCQKEFQYVIDRVQQDQIVVDLVRIRDEMKSEGNYHGVGW